MSQQKEIYPPTDPREWVTAYADYLYAFVRQRIADEEQARDLVQDTFLAALEKRSSFQGHSLERTWLISILKHKIIDLYRKQSGIKNSTKDYHSDNPDAHAFFEENGYWKKECRPTAFGIEAAADLENEEFDLVLKQCLKKLPPLWSAVFTLKHLDEEDSPKICTALHLSAANFWVIMHRAKLELRNCLNKNWQKE